MMARLPVLLPVLLPDLLLALPLGAQPQPERVEETTPRVPGQARPIRTPGAKPETVARARQLVVQLRAKAGRRRAARRPARPLGRKLGPVLPPVLLLVQVHNRTP